jgi:hypothetical protein
MPLVADRVKDTGTVTGTGAVTLANTSSAGYITFASAFAIGSVVWYCIETTTPGSWEVGFGTLTSATALTRDTCTASSNSNMFVSFPSSTAVTVFCTAAADLVESGDGGRIQAQVRNLAMN